MSISSRRQYYHRDHPVPELDHLGPTKQLVSLHLGQGRQLWRVIRQASSHLHMQTCPVLAALALAGAVGQQSGCDGCNFTDVRTAGSDDTTSTQV